MRLDDEAAVLHGPVVSPCVSKLIVHTLLYDDPVSMLIEDEGVMIEAVAILD